ncbi:hypothetical protein [uncultured Tateyamaria sp.]|uniref:hypothetical protein n=1 Tax=uncultured Tateyamaria sp. TaxID=455651 RepID=UPI002623E2B9|nr:hypothetical protein [uncultured Tateyamaria sp.]
MSDEPNAAREGEMLSLFRDAHAPLQSVIMLMAYASLRNDEVLWKGLEAVGYMKRPDAEEDDIGEPDLALLGRLRSVCPEDEVTWWGNAIVHAYLEGDRPRKDALLDLIQRRLAN